MPTCRHCKFTGSSDTWGRYKPTERNPAGILHKLCPACDQMASERRAAVAEARVRGYESVANTPEYKRKQAEREAANEGRTLCTYVPLAERKRHAEMLCADAEAGRVRRRYFVSLLKEFNRIEMTRPEVLAEMRREDASAYREYYSRNAQREVVRHLAWKAANPARVVVQHDKRAYRIKAKDDGTLTVPALRKLKAHASRCAYCDNPFVSTRDQQTDHMIALCHGGAHSVRNVVIACQRCNGRKARLTYVDWLDRIEPAHRRRAEALYLERYGDPDEAALVATTARCGSFGPIVVPRTSGGTWANVAQTGGI